MTKKPKKWTLSELPITFWSISVLVVVALIIVAITSFHRLNTERILAVADRFIPNPSWEPIVDNYEPSRFLCIGDVACPSVHRSWRTDEQFSYEDFIQFMEQGGARVTVEPGCTLKQSPQPESGHCSAYGVIDKVVYVQAYVETSAQIKANNTLSLFLQ